MYGEERDVCTHSSSPAWLGLAQAALTTTFMQQAHMLAHSINQVDETDRHKQGQY